MSWTIWQVSRRAQRLLCKPERLYTEDASGMSTMNKLSAFAGTKTLTGHNSWDLFNIKSMVCRIMGDADGGPVCTWLKVSVLTSSSSTKGKSARVKHGRTGEVFRFDTVYAGYLSCSYSCSVGGTSPTNDVCDSLQP